MKKILLVALLGGLGLWLFVAMRRDRDAALEAPVAALGAGSPATPAASTAPAPPAPAPAPAPVAAAPAADEAACAHLAQLCSTSDRAVNVGECRKQLDDARKVSGPGNVERSEQCLAEARTCAAASGCISGGVGMGAMGEFLKGFGAALSR